MRKTYPFGFATILVVYLMAMITLGNFVERTQAVSLFFGFGTAFISYLLLTRATDSNQLLFATGILARIALFFSLPILSDDLYRFIWDGSLLAEGINPFAELPTYYTTTGSSDLSRALFEKLNSPAYFTIYPPTNQALFYLSVLLSGGSWLGFANLIRLLLLAADLGSLYFLRQLLIRNNKDANLAMLYFLNPLVILEFTGNLHFEGFVICFLLMGIYYFQKSKKGRSAIGFGMAAAIKLLPLIFLPAVFFNGWKKRQWSVAILAGFILVLSLLPMLNTTFINGMKNSLELYFQKFEFNASLYFVVREIGFWIKGYNTIQTIAPILSLTSAIAILLLSILGWKKEWPLAKTLLFVLTIYLIFSTTVHPWYIIPLVPLGLITGFYFPVVWTYLIFLTYFGYTADGFQLPAYLIIIEYFVITIFAIAEFRLKIHQSK